MEDYRNIFSERLNELRKKKRLSKLDFATQISEKIKIVKPAEFSHDPTYGSLTVESLYAAAKMFGVSTDYMLGLSDKPCEKGGVDQ